MRLAPNVVTAPLSGLMTTLFVVRIESCLSNGRLGGDTISLGCLVLGLWGH